jgi:hypothetical protein
MMESTASVAFVFTPNSKTNSDATSVSFQQQ